MNQLFKLSLVAIVICTTACKKEGGDEGTRLQMMVGRLSNSDDSTFTTHFQYDGQNRVIEITESMKQSIDKTVYQFFYDSKSRLAKATTDNGFGKPTIDSFYYDNNDRLIKKLLVSDDPTYPFFEKVDISYDAAGRLTADTITIAGNPEQTFTKYVFNANNDLVEWESFYTYQGNIWSYGKATATYGTNKNPYPKLGIGYFLLKRENLLLSEHERSALNYPGRPPIFYQYEYTSNGLIKKITLNNVPVAPYVTLLDFYYE